MLSFAFSHGEPPQLGAEVFLLRAEGKGQHAWLLTRMD